MAKRRNRYKEMERYMTRVLVLDGLLFILYLIFAGLGITWMRIIMSVLAILLSVLCLGFLLISKEFFRQRSLWMSVCAAAVLICIVLSLILHYPSPNPYKSKNDPSNEGSVYTAVEYAAW